MLFKSLFSSLIFAGLVVAGAHNAPRRRHAGINSLPTEPEHAQNATLLKRGQSFQNTRFSMYYPETGNQVACGGFYHNEDWIVALNAAQFESISGHMCGQQVTMSLNGKSAQVTIVDECPGCPYGGLDCTPAVASFFGFFNDLAWGSWTVGGGDPAPSSAPPPPPPPPSSTKQEPSSTPPPPPPPPSSTSTSHSHSHTSSTWSSSSVWSSSSASSSSATSSSTSASTSSSVPASSTSASSTASSTSASATPTPMSNLIALYSNFVNMALLNLAGENSQ